MHAASMRRTKNPKVTGRAAKDARKALHAKVKAGQPRTQPMAGSRPRATQQIRGKVAAKAAAKASSSQADPAKTPTPRRAARSGKAKPGKAAKADGPVMDRMGR